MVPARLVEEIGAGHCVAFMGAGLSGPAFPGWVDLLGLLAAAVDDERLVGRIHGLLAQPTAHPRDRPDAGARDSYRMSWSGPGRTG